MAKKERIATGCSDDDEEGDEVPMEALPVGPDDAAGPVAAAATADVDGNGHGTVSPTRDDPWLMNLRLTRRDDNAHDRPRKLNLLAHVVCFELCAKPHGL